MFRSFEGSIYKNCHQRCTFGDLLSWATPPVYADVSSLFTVASCQWREHVLTPAALSVSGLITAPCPQRAVSKATLTQTFRDSDQNFISEHPRSWRDLPVYRVSVVCVCEDL